MEHKFGIFHTVEELNRAAAAQKAQGDIEALEALAAENGIEWDDAEDYLEGMTEELATPLMAALGKLELEEKELELESQLKDWKDFIALLCTEDIEMCHGVFRPDRHLEDVLAEGLKYASKHRISLPAVLTKKAGIPAGSAIGMTGRDELRRIAQMYYLGKGEEI
ncbi:MAG: hypothetical protein HFH88_14820 [Lachnospiraceae bacterium]|jgi:signal transduction histidine kinase|nr:hypothetical protein [Lachnospiraceae bacterium]